MCATNDVGDLWIPDPDKHWSDVDIRNGFHIRRFVNEDSKNWWNKCNYKVYNILAWCILLGLGSLLKTTMKNAIQTMKRITLSIFTSGRPFYFQRALYLLYNHLLII